MKKLILSALCIFVLGGFIFMSCKSKNDADAISPKFKTEAVTGTGNNPEITNVTTTGTISITSSQPSSVMNGIGTVGVWSNVNCSTPAPTCLTTSNNNLGSSISICFSSPPVAGVYQFVSSASLLGPGKAFMTINNPPSQDAGSVWYSDGGAVTVVTNAPSITATFSNIVCKQTPGSFYTVTASGQVGCL